MKSNATLSTLAFFVKCEGWHSFNPKCRATVRAVRSLAKRGFLEIAEGLNMARFTGKVFQ
jgi:hypothetical protein